MNPTEKVRDIWEAFCAELTHEPTDDMKEALSTVIRNIAEDLYGDGMFMNRAEEERFAIADDLGELADALENLE